jgi:GT2 family glycosyltransferase
VELSVVIVNYNSGGLLARCLDGLDEEDVVVVDNASTDGSGDLPPGTGARRIRMEENVGFARAANAGIRATRGDLVLLLNPDVVLTEGSLDRMVRRLRSDPGLGVLGPRIRETSGGGHAHLIPFPSNRGLFREALFIDRILPPRPPGRGWLPGCCLLIRREAIEAIGPFDEDFFLYYEDVDLFWRMSHSPWRTGIDSRSEAIHHGGERDARYGAAKLTWYHESLQEFYRKHYGRRDLSGLRRILILRSAIRLGLWTALYLVSPSRRVERMDRLRGYGRVLRSLVRGVNGRSLP